MKLKITKSDKKALLAALAVCGIGILFSILIVLGVDIYRKHTYTSVILPDAYRITDMRSTEPATRKHCKFCRAPILPPSCTRATWPTTPRKKCWAICIIPRKTRPILGGMGTIRYS